MSSIAGTVRFAAIVWVSASLASATAGAVITDAPAPKSSVRVNTETVARGLDYPWAFQFLPDGRILVTERGGSMRVVATNGTLSPPLPGVPRVAAVGQGGLLDVALAPDFATSNQIYFSYSEPRGGGRQATSVARARLQLTPNGGRLHDVQVIFRQQPASRTSRHFGSRLAFAPDGSLFVTVGDRGASTQAQRPGNHIGKVLRVSPDGSVQPDNPRRAGWAPRIWSVGHRNPQAAAIHPVTGRLWTVEHGARGGDEVNIPLKGRNYGWPTISYGRHYSGARIGEGTKKAGLEQPLYYWDPSIAPSGMAFYTGDLIPQWKGNLFVGALAGRHLARLVLDGEQVVASERLLAGLDERIRDVRQGPDGALYVATDSGDGRILRLAPAN